MKTFTSIIVLLGLFLNISAQTALTYKNQAIKPGDSHHFYLVDKVSEGTSGPNQLWDFSKLKKTGELTSLMLNPSETAGGSLIPDANAVIRENNVDFFFKVTNNEILDYGFASCGNVFKYDKPLVKIKFPFQYGSIQQGEFHGTDVNKPEVQLSGTYKIEVDGYGKLILPGEVAADNVVRLKSTRTEGGSSIVTYRWYTSNLRYPLLTVIKSENGGNTTPILGAYYAGSLQKTAQLEETNSGNDDMIVSVYPVPFSDELTIDYTLYNSGSVKIELLDNSGKPIKSLVSSNLEEGAYKESVSGQEHKLAQGVYFVRAIINGKVLIKKVIKI